MARLSVVYHMARLSVVYHMARLSVVYHMARLSVVYHMARLSVVYHMARLSVVVLMVEGLQIVFPSRGVSRFELVVLSHYPKDSCMYVCVCMCMFVCVCVRACVRVCVATPSSGKKQNTSDLPCYGKPLVPHQDLLLILAGVVFCLGHRHFHHDHDHRHGQKSHENHDLLNHHRQHQYYEAYSKNYCFLPVLLTYKAK